MIYDLNWINFGARDCNYVTIACILSVTIFCAIYSSLKKDYPLPPLPGPIGLPIVGYFPFLGPRPHSALAKLAKKFGPAYQVQLGSKRCLVLCSYEAIRDSIIRQSDVYSGRPEISLLVYKTETAFVFDEGQTFKDVRQFSMAVLKRLGFGRLSLEPFVKLEVHDLIAKLTRFNSEPAEISHMLQQSVGNAICTLINGKRSSINDPWLSRLILAVDGLRDTNTHDHSLFFPWLKKLPLSGKFTNVKAKRYWKDELWRVWQEKIDEVKTDIEQGHAPDCFITTWFKEADKRERTNDPYRHLYSEFNLRNNLDIFAQGSFETTSTTILWGLQFLINHPEVQDKMYAEIIKYLDGKEFDLSFCEAKHMPYTKAVIQEIHRLSSIVPLGVFHRTTDESILMGYTVPKGITVIICHCAVHSDPDNFPEPSHFKPERHLTDNGEFIKNENVIPFSVGKRFCPGEFVAQMEIFHYLTEIVYEFTLELGPNNKNYGQSSDNTLVSYPLPFTIRFKPRSK